MKIREDFIHLNEYTRPGTYIPKIKGVVVHWTGAPGQSADMVHRYFDYFALKEKKSVSAHYVIGLDGEIVNIIPENEVAYHVSNRSTPRDIVDKYGYPNFNMLGIECCVKDINGSMPWEVTESLRWLLGDICGRYVINPVEAMFRHYDVTVRRKDCPRWYVNHPCDWYNLQFAVFHDLLGKLPFGLGDDDEI